MTDWLTFNADHEPLVLDTKIWKVDLFGNLRKESQNLTPKGCSGWFKVEGKIHNANDVAGTLLVYSHDF